MFYSIPDLYLTFFQIIGIILNTTLHFKSLQQTDRTFSILPAFLSNAIPNKTDVIRYYANLNFFISPVLINSKYTIDIIAVSLTEVIMPQMRVSIKEVVP